MTLRTLLLATGLLAAGAAPASAVVGGQPAPLAEYPFLVSSPGCTGALVAPDRLLTAAHCVLGHEAAREHWRLGASSAAPGRALGIADVAAHPGFDGDAALNVDDIAVLRVDPPATGVPPLRMAGPQDAALTAPGRTVRTVGYGATSVTGPLRAPRFGLPSKDAMQADLTVVADGSCDAYYRGLPDTPTPIPAGVVCAGARDAGACPGDSGGPLLARDAAGAWVGVGVFSFLERCGTDGGEPGGWTDVLAHRAFVTDPAPVWAPQPLGGRARITGRRRVGGVITCVPPAFRGAVTARRTTWEVAGHPVVRIPASRSGRHRVTRREAGRRLTCEAAASNPGGFAVSRGAAPVRIARR